MSNLNHFSTHPLVGTDVRKLAKDGYTAQNIVGCDLRDTFIESGFKLFHDKETCGINFFSDDIFELSPTPATTLGQLTKPFNESRRLEDLKGRLSHVYTGALFHLFTEEPQYAIAIRLIRLLKEDESNCVIFGRHLGREFESIVKDFPGR